MDEGLASMTNYVYISPAFPPTNVNICEHLARSGVRVLGIGDTPYPELPQRLVDSLAEYYVVGSLEDYDQVHRAVAYLTFKHGRIDWLESNNEYWLNLDAKLRTDFNITTGRQTDRIGEIRSKASMKDVYLRAGIPTARQIKVGSLAAAEEFIAEVGYPVIVKPEFGVGATHTYKLGDHADLVGFFAETPHGSTVMEEFITGDIISYDGVVDHDSKPVFEAATQWPPSIMDIVLNDLDLAYQVLPEVDEKLRERGLRTLSAFGVRNRFFHLEFFRLTKARAGLGEVGDYVALEVNMRPAGGVTLDMYNYARQADIYQIYADVVSGRDSGAAALAASATGGCVYAGRRDHHHYRMSASELLAKYGAQIVRHERNLPMFVPQMCDEYFLLRPTDAAQADEFIADALEQA